CSAGDVDQLHAYTTLENERKNHFYFSSKTKNENICFVFPLRNWNTAFEGPPFRVSKLENCAIKQAKVTKTV
ncbi:hypothetical protein V5799_027632, partial [Amblyomma americanum]